MAWQLMALNGILLIVSAVVGGGVKLIGGGQTPRFQGVARAFAVGVAGVLMLALAFVTWRGAGTTQQTQQTGVPGALNPLMHEINDFVAQWTVEMGPTDLTLNPTSGKLRTPIHATGSGFLPGEKVDLLSGMTVLTTVLAGKDGHIDTPIRLKNDEWCHDDQCEITVQGKQSLKWTTAIYNLT